MVAFLSNNISVVNFSLINIALGLSIYLTLTTGLLSLANAGFMAIGAYTAAVLATQAGVPLGVGFVSALVLGGLVALPLGMVVLRLRMYTWRLRRWGLGRLCGLWRSMGIRWCGR